jgi:hypothetical protein
MTNKQLTVTKRMGESGRKKRKNQESLSGCTQLIVVGLVIAIIGSVIAASYQKATITNYAGFGMLLGGISLFIFGFCGTACSAVNKRCAESPAWRTTKPRMLSLSIWSIGVGLVLSILGSILGSDYAKKSMMNGLGFGMLLTGICFFVLGIFGTVLGTLQGRLTGRRRRAGLKVDRPRFLYSSILSIGVGLVLIIVGSIVAGSFAKQTMFNYVGFGTLLVGVAVLTLGMSGAVVTILKSNWDQTGARGTEPQVMLGSIWAIGIGAMLLITGSLIASSYAKNSLMNYSGFAMLLSGTGVFVYGLFETARFSTIGLLSGKLTGHREQRDNLPRLKSFWVNTVKTTAMLNLAGVMAALGLLFFSLWQLDLIVSGPVWWQSSPNGVGWSWRGPGAYAKDYFQCFIWKTTVGQAYDTLFMLIFISFIILFSSAFFWPRSSEAGNVDLTVRAKRHASSRNSKNRARRKSIQKNQPVTPQIPSVSQKENGTEGGT